MKSTECNIKFKKQQQKNNKKTPITYKSTYLTKIQNKNHIKLKTSKQGFVVNRQPEAVTRDVF